MSATCHRFDHSAYGELVASEIARIAALLGSSDPETPVTTCPGWTFADLAAHVGGVHRWCEQMVRERAQQRLRRDSGAPEPAARAAWVGSFAGPLTATFAASDPDAEMWAWGADKHARFWPRRMLHETAVHRADAEISLGVAPVIDAAVAFDGVDEFLDNLPRAEYFAPKVAHLRGDGETIALETDGARWLITLRPDRFDWSHDAGGRADVTVRATPADLLLFAYGRRAPADLGTEGDAELLARWVENSKI